MAFIFRSYNTALIRRPMLTQCATAAALFAGGDLIAQQAVEKKGMAHDYHRTARLSFYGAIIFAPIMTKWYQWLGSINIRNPTKAIAFRVGLDQIVLSPIAVGFFFATMAFMEGKGIEEAKSRISTAYFPTLLRNWSVFLPAQIINFAIVPSHLRLGFVGVISLFWNSYLSFTNAGQAASKRSN